MPSGRCLRLAHGATVALLAALITLAVVTSSALASSTDQAVAYQLDPAHDGYQTGDPLTTPLSSIWSVTLPATVSYPLIVNGVVYVTSGSDLYAIEQATGTILWSRDVGAGNMGLAYDAGQIFTVTESGTLAAYDATTGGADWTTTLLGQQIFTSAPTAVDGDVYTSGAGGGGTLYGVSQATGQLVWTGSVENGDHSSPAVDADGVYVTYAGDQDYDFDPVSGSLLWHYDATGIEGGGGKTPVLANGEIFGRDAGSGNVVLSASGGSHLGTFSSTPPPAAGGGLLDTVHGGVLTAIGDWGAGLNAFTFSGDSQLDTAPLIVGSLTFIGSQSGNVYAVNASGTSVWSANMGAPVPAPDEQNPAVLTGMAAGEGTLVVPAGDTLSAFAGASVGSGKPANESTPTISDTPYVGRPIGADVGRWSALPTTYSYQWWLCAYSGDPCSQISGATSEAYTPTSTEVGDTLEVSVSATNGSGTAEAVFSPKSPAIDIPPSPDVAPSDLTLPTVSDPDPVQGETITATPGTWTEDATSFTYQWFYCYDGDCGAESPPSTSDSYTVGPDDIGDQLYVQVTASNAGGGAADTPATSALTSPVGTFGPVSQTTPTISGMPQVGDTLTGSVGTWTGNPTSYETQWFSCDIYGITCNAVGEADSNTYAPTAADLGDVIDFAVYAIDADGYYSELTVSDGAGPVVAAASTLPSTSSSHPNLLPFTTVTVTPPSPSPVSPALVRSAPTPALTRAEKLAAALKACARLPKHKRAACETRARKRFGAEKDSDKRVQMRLRPAGPRPSLSLGRREAP